MSGAVDKLASVLLYEGIVLDSHGRHGRSTHKSRRPWSFGNLLPRTFSEEQSGEQSGEQLRDPLGHEAGGERWWMRTECLLRGTPSTRISVSVRFLHLRGFAAPAPEELHMAHAPHGDGGTGRGAHGDARGQRPIQEADERVLGLPMQSVSRLLEQGMRLDFGFPDRRFTDEDERWWQEEISGSIDVRLATVCEGVYRLAVRVENGTALLSGARRAAAELRGLAAAHVLLTVDEGEFCSLLDPPCELRGAAAACNNVGVWPVLIGAENDHSSMMASPIILYDHPKLAPASPADLFDSNELQSRRVVASDPLGGDGERDKRESRATDARARALPDHGGGHSEGLGPEALGRLHGALLSPRSRPPGRPRLSVGAHVRLHPRARGDVFDLVLSEASATVVAVEQDAAGRTHYAVTVDDDPGRDLGVQGLPGHRFYFPADEIEPW